MTSNDLQALLTAQYATSHALHVELSRVRDAHGDGFLYDLHYLMLSSAAAASTATIESLNLLRVATVPSVPAEPAV